MYMYMYMYMYSYTRTRCSSILHCVVCSALFESFNSIRFDYSSLPAPVSRSPEVRAHGPSRRHVLKMYASVMFSAAVTPVTHLKLTKSRTFDHNSLCIPLMRLLQVFSFQRAGGDCHRRRTWHWLRCRGVHGAGRRLCSPFRYECGGSCQGESEA